MRNENRVERIEIKVTKEEKEKLLKIAKSYNLKVSEYLRFTGLNSTIKGEVNNAKTINT